MATRLRFAAGALLAAVLVAACRTLPPPPPLGADELVAAVAGLEGPPGGDHISALYRLRIPRASGLRASIRTVGDAGRLSVSGPFGRPVSLATWTERGGGDVFDLEDQCRVPGADLEALFGVGRLPIAQAVRLLAGRLPALEHDELRLLEGAVQVQGTDWSARVTLGRDPWRVLTVEAATAAPSAWRIDIDKHVRALPQSIHIQRADGEYVRLELIRMERSTDGHLEDLPDYPDCVPRARR